MLKEERQEIMLELINKKGVLTVQDAVELLNVSDMTVRRDFSDLEESNAIKRVHGGAISVGQNIFNELSHTQKQELHIDEKVIIAKQACALIEDGDSIFLGTGTTTELLIDYIEADSLFIITNSLPVFNKIINSHIDYNVYLIGGYYRSKTGAFIGSFSNEIAERINVNKAFIGTNGIKENGVYTAHIEEGTILKIILNNANKKYLLADHYKFDKDDLYNFYDLSNFDAIITDSKVHDSVINQYQKYTSIEKGKKKFD